MKRRKFAGTVLGNIDRVTYPASPTHSSMLGGFRSLFRTSKTRPGSETPSIVEEKEENASIIPDLNASRPTTALPLVDENTKGSTC